MVVKPAEVPCTAVAAFVDQRAMWLHGKQIKRCICMSDCGSTRCAIQYQFIPKREYSSLAVCNPSVDPSVVPLSHVRTEAATAKHRTWMDRRRKGAAPTELRLASGRWIAGTEVQRGLKNTAVVLYDAPAAALVRSHPTRSSFGPAPPHRSRLKSQVAVASCSCRTGRVQPTR